MQKRLKLKNTQQKRRLNRAKHKVANANNLHGLKSKLPIMMINTSNAEIYVQFIQDGKTLASASSLKIKKGTKTEKAEEVGKIAAENAKKAKITKIAFCKGSTTYHGRVRALADAARKGGLKF